VPRLTMESHEARRNRILKAARAVIVRDGLRATTTHAVARAAGVPVGSIYTYFADKDELVWASILAANREESEAALRNMRAGGTARERLRRALGDWYAYTIDEPGVARALSEIWAEAATKPLIRDLVARRRERIIVIAQLILRDGIATGELPATLDPDAASRAIACLLDGIVLERVERGAELTFADVERRVDLIARW
jgi:AcrR family transcriptional regulator